VTGPAPASGFLDVVASAASPALREALVGIGGWIVQAETPLAADVAALWPAARDLRGRRFRLGPPGARRGFFTIVEWERPDLPLIRPSGRSWDSGGVFDVNVRVADIDESYARLLDAGWHGYGDPVSFRWDRFDVRQVVMQGPDGVVLALIEDPDRYGDGATPWSEAFNSTQVVRDLPRARHFYEVALGFSTFTEASWTEEEPGFQVLGLPRPYASIVPRRVAILHPRGLNEGSVELLAFDGLSGRDFASRSRPPHRGLLALRFPVDDLDAVRARIEAAGYPLAGECAVCDLPGLGRVRVLPVQAPDGAWLELCQSVDDA
jgi:catechol 2,3-dioxygenase-like lactoylglutathione lyase family enzyme